MVEERNGSPPLVLLDRERAEAIEAELAHREREIAALLVDRYKASLYVY